MSKQQHTPWPWYRSGYTVYALDDKKSRNRFAAQVQDAHTPREELLAVATLMQAAPELLQALEILETTCELGLLSDHSIRQFARAAIARARGEL